jgi:hypothetical protein
VAGSESFDHELDAVVHALTGDVPAATEGEHIIANMALLDAIYVQAGVARPADREETRA